MKYKFLGKPDKIFPQLKHGEVYDLIVEILGEGFMGLQTRPVIISPIYCPYSSWETFHQNWKPIPGGQFDTLATEVREETLKLVRDGVIEGPPESRERMFESLKQLQSQREK